MRGALTAAGRHLTRIEELISKVLLALLVLLVFVPAVTRTFNRPIIWSIEIAQLLFAWLAFLGANQAMRAGAHIGVDVLTRHLPPRPRRLVALFNLALIAAFLASLLWYGIELTFVSVDRRFMTTQLSFAFATVAAPLGAALLLLTTMGKIAELFRSDPDPDPDPDPDSGAGADRSDPAVGGSGRRRAAEPRISATGESRRPAVNAIEGIGTPAAGGRDSPGGDRGGAPGSPSRTGAARPSELRPGPAKPPPVPGDGA